MNERSMTEPLLNLRQPSSPSSPAHIRSQMSDSEPNLKMQARVNARSNEPPVYLPQYASSSDLDKSPSHKKGKKSKHKGSGESFRNVDLHRGDSFRDKEPASQEGGQMFQVIAEANKKEKGTLTGYSIR